MNPEKPQAEPETRSQHIAAGVAIVASIIAIILRVVPHPTNLSSVGAVGLFGGARVRSWYAYLMPLGVMILSDLILWALTGFNYQYSIVHFSRIYVYSAFMMYVVIGRGLHDKNSLGATALAATLGGLMFFTVTNFCAWLFQPFEFVPEAFRYTRDVNGLLACFAAALPFYPAETSVTAYPFMLLTDYRLNIFWNVLGDIGFTTVYLVAHGTRVQRPAATAPSPVPATNA